MRKHNRDCSRCGKPYYRSNALRLWTQQNPGHRKGWHRDVVKLCTNCMTADVAVKARHLVSARIVSINMPRRKVS